MKPRDVRIEIEREAGLRVPETPGEFDGFDPLLMPEGGTPVPQAVRRPSERPHGFPDFVAVRDAEWELALQRGNKEAWGLDDAAEPLPLGSLSWYPNLRRPMANVGAVEGQRLGYTGTKLFHRDDGKPVAWLHSFEDAHDVILVGWTGFRADYAWQLHLPVSCDVGNIGEVQDQPELGDEQPDSAGLVGVREPAHPSDHVAGTDFLYGKIAERLDEDGGAEPVAVQSPMADVAAGSKPFSVYVTEDGVPYDGTLKLTFRILGRGEPFPDHVAPDKRFFLSSEGPSVLDLAVATTTPIADVEPAAVPGVPSPNVKRGHQ